MDTMQAINERHSVRQYKPVPIEEETAAALNEFIGKINAESGLSIQLVLNEPKAFDSSLAHYGKLTGISNYIALIGKKSKTLQEECGYYGEKIVLEAQKLGLNTCWVGVMFKKVPEAFRVNRGEKLALMIAVGYGETQGHEHKSKAMSQVSEIKEGYPGWFIRGVEAALLAPTAMNQQRFFFTLDGDKVTARAFKGPFSKVDLGIVKYHFEAGSGKDSSIWT